MARRRTASTRNQLTELSHRAPLVAAQRLMRLAATAHAPTAADHREVTRMGVEKWQAMQAGWFAMAAATLDWQARAFGAAVQAAWMPWSASASAGTMPWVPAWSDVDRVMAAGLQPTSRTVSANARRLRGR
ncbi:hypothetical protein [Lysobacter sp. A3-1-A15]|uniref:hypothetical protein n=1 Tax=Novilysobacter viscosus TaxID=3098602 RepID=UPI002EDB1FCD